MNYIYDGSFEGLLTAIYESYYRRENPGRILAGNNLQQSFLEENVIIHTDEEKAYKVYNSIKAKISPAALRRVYYVFLSEYDEAGTWIYEYLKLGWKVGGKLDLHLSDKRVLNVHNASRKVSFEKARMLGLVRFKKLRDNLFYACIEPDHNIVSLLAPHFAKRLSDQNWIIHDVKRRIAALYNTREWIIAGFDANPHTDVEEDELFCQKLWKLYFNSIAIRSRENPRLQKRMMPVRYWKYLVEKQLF